MMRIGIVSDSHNAPERLAAALRAMGPIHTLIHLGDGLRDLRDPEVRALLPERVLEVRGNNDWSSEAPESRAMKPDGRTVMFLTHGHRQNVKFSLDRLYYAALEEGARIACYGHTHLARADFENGVWLVNPGAVPRYALVDIEDGMVTPRLCNVP